MKTLVECVVLGGIIISSMYGYCVHFADRVAQVAGGYIVAMFIVPAVFGALLGRIAAGCCGVGSGKGWNIYWWMIPLGVLLANIPSVYYIVFLMFFMEGS